MEGNHSLNQDGKKLKLGIPHLTPSVVGTKLTNVDFGNRPPGS